MAKVEREPLKPTIGQVRGSGEDAKARAKADQERRLDKHKIRRILLPHEAQTGQWNADKVLRTTLGMDKGTRDLTREDLEVFKRNMGTVTGRFGVASPSADPKKPQTPRFLPGLTARQVIAFALESRRERARDEIHAGVPVSGNVHGGTGASATAVVRFITNAGPKCQHTPNRHHVTVEFVNYFSAVNNVSITAVAGAKWLTGLPLRFDCDCEDHTYRFRYIATIGGFAFGRQETGYPKERNVNLEGVACKHVIRVMQQIDSSVYVTRFLTTMIERSRKSKAGRGQARTSQQHAEEMFNRQVGKPSKIKVHLAKILKEATKKKPIEKETYANKRAVAKTQTVDQRINVIRQQLQALGLPKAVVDAQIDTIKSSMK